MPWVNKEERLHDCIRDPERYIPTAEYAYKELNAQLGSVYECDKPGCQRLWRLEDSQKDGIFWMPVKS